MTVAVLGGKLSKAQAACLYGVSPKIVSHWTGRLRTSGRGVMMDRSSRPRTSPRQTNEELAERIIELRKQRLTGRHIAMETSVRPPLSAAFSSMKDIAPAEPVVHYEYAEPGGLIHLDIKRLGRFDRIGHRITGDRTGQNNSRGVG